MLNTWKVGLVTGAVAVMTAGLAGCSSGGSPSSNSSDTNGTTTTSNTSPSTSSGSGQGAALTIVPAPYGSFQDNFNPFEAATTANGGTSGFIYEPLFYYNIVGPEKYGLLGKDMSWSNGNKTLTVTLSDNVKWTDGQPFTSKDVVFTFDLLKKYPAIDTNGVWSELTDVKASGDNEVVFTFKKADVPFAMYVVQTLIVPEHIWSSVPDPSKYSNDKPVGTGPYVLDSFSAQDYKFKANDNYYLGKPSVPELNFPAYSSNDTADLALAQGGVAWGGAFIPNIDKVFTSKSSHNKYWFPPNNDVMLVPNLKNPILSQPVVRKAMSMAINRDDISQKGEYGYEKVASPTAVLLPNNQDWMDPNLPQADQSFTYDPTGAEKLLQSAGYKKNSSGVYQTPDGKPLSFTLQVVAGWTDWDMDAQLLAQQLGKIGIKVQVQQQQYAGYEAALKDHKFDLAVASSGGGPNPYYIYQTVFGKTGQFNYEQWSDPTTDAALSDFSQTTDTTKQKQDIYKVERIVAEQLPTIPLVYGATWYEYNDSQYTGWPDAQNPYVTPAPWAWPAPEIILMDLKPTS
ncbi:ABC transporter substrate-binding protein [Alicyclobacillus dauci]|uniref:ABC transporter substrate-binding protein n=1 Tax=Alicyclobacillus dauci TaxID=1475485 RepID=A0ABY6Z5R0_9BACL|nr:ABC transporter substrate-binding protein [Alicyclobacillus dauci]WAH37619.1 ABC transporter substrate-binding protein [Alicyclobacillus dauci]